MWSVKCRVWSGECHQIAQRWQCDSQKSSNTTRLKCCACHAKWHRKSPKCCACHEKMANASFWKCRKSIARATHVEMSQSATPATRNEATRCWKTTKMIPFAKLTMGTAIWSSRGRLRTVANGCGPLRTVADGCARSGEHSSTPPHTPRVKQEPLPRIRKKKQNTSRCHFCIWEANLMTRWLSLGEYLDTLTPRGWTNSYSC